MKAGRSSSSADTPSLRSVHLNQKCVIQQKGASYFVVSLFESGLSEAPPAVGSVDGSSSFESNIKVAALDGEVEPSALILDKMECDLLLYVRPIEAPRDQETRTSGYPFCCKYAMML